MMVKVKHILKPKPYIYLLDWKDSHDLIYEIFKIYSSIQGKTRISGEKLKIILDMYYDKAEKNNGYTVFLTILYLSIKCCNF